MKQGHGVSWPSHFISRLYFFGMTRNKLMSYRRRDNMRELPQR